MNVGDIATDAEAKEAQMAVVGAMCDFVGVLVAKGMKDGDIQMAVRLLVGNAFDQPRIASCIAHNRAAREQIDMLGGIGR